MWNLKRDNKLVSITKRIRFTDTEKNLVVTRRVREEGRGNTEE